MRVADVPVQLSPFNPPRENTLWSVTLYTISRAGQPETASLSAHWDRNILTFHSNSLSDDHQAQIWNEPILPLRQQSPRQFVLLGSVLTLVEMDFGQSCLLRGNSITRFRTQSWASRTFRKRKVK